MLKHRLIFGTLMIFALTGLLWLDNRVGALPVDILPGHEVLPAGIVMLAIVLLLILLGTRELAAMATKKEIPCDVVQMAAAAAGVCILTYIIRPDHKPEMAIGFFGLLVGFVFLLTPLRTNMAYKSTEKGFAAVGFSMLSLVYLGVLPAFYVAIRHHHSAWVIAAVIMVIKCCDIGAYFTGRAIGRNKLIPWLSPGKTIEGLVGGMATSAIVATLFALASNHYDASGYWVIVDGLPTFVSKPMPLIWAAVAGAIFGGVGQYGDLIESLFKRDADVKDSGNSIPGFGGVLDLVDSPLGAAPLAYLALMFYRMM